MNENSYWQRRNLQREKDINKQALHVENVLLRAYTQAQSYLTDKARQLFKRMQTASGLTEEQARYILNSSMPPETLVELQKQANQIDNAQLRKEAQNRLTAESYKFRITRADELKARSYIAAKQVADVQLQAQTEFYVDVIKKSFGQASAEIFMRRARELRLTAKFPVEVWNKETAYELTYIPTQQVETILNRKWLGSNYSKRIWGNTEKLAQKLEEMFTVEALTGKQEIEFVKELQAEFGTSFNVARRLVRTEANYIHNQSQLEAWQKNGVKQYILIAVHDLRTSEICKKKDKKIFSVSEAECNGENGTFPPFHPWCRTVAVAYFGKRTLNGTIKALDPVTRETFDLPRGATYDDWFKKITELHSQDEIDATYKKIMASLKYK